MDKLKKSGYGSGGSSKIEWGFLLFILRVKCGIAKKELKRLTMPEINSLLEGYKRDKEEGAVNNRPLR